MFRSVQQHVAHIGASLFHQTCWAPIRSLRHALPQEVPLIVSGRAVNLLAKPIEHTHAAADFGLIIARMRAEGVLPGGAGARAEELPEETERA